MPKVSERERIQALEAKLKQLKVVQQRKEARARTAVLKAWLQAAITKVEDRAPFGLEA